MEKVLYFHYFRTVVQELLFRVYLFHEFVLLRFEYVEISSTCSKL